MEFHDPLTYPQLIAYYDAVDEVQALRENGKKEIPVLKLRFILLPSLIGCVKKWNLENFPTEVTEKNFPATPNQPAGELIDWIQSEVILLMTEASEVPNG